MRILNILNGESFKEYFIKDFNVEEDVVSFNECLVDGELHKHIFTEEFFSVRKDFFAKKYGVSNEVYKEKSIKELRPLLNNKYDRIILWFDFDMFCQINMLTALAYLDINKFKGSVTVNIIKRDFISYSYSEVIEDKIQLHSLDKFNDLYVDTLIKKDFEKIDNPQYTTIFNNLPHLKSGIILYRNYKSSKNEIKDFINKNREKERKDILMELFKKFYNYGLGDTQYIKLLDEMGVV